MSEYRAPFTEMQFLLEHVFGAHEHWCELFGDDAPTLELAEAVLDEAGKLASELIHPASAVGDEQGCQLDGDVVTVPACFQQPWQALVEGGWIGLGASSDHGGQGMPKLLASMVEEMQWSNPALRLYAAGTNGAVLCMEDYASEEMKQCYLPQMNAGQWTGTMAMTEPHCGTDLGLMRTRAVPVADGSFELNGTKIFITGGDQDLTENIVHLVLAKLPDAPTGTRGISLFLVPKVLLNADGGLGERNGVSCASLEQKMGIKGSATCVLNFDGAKGWMIGEPNRGLKAMFTMMNYERVNVGLQGLGQAEVAYQYAAEYAKERRQGRALSGVIDPEQEADNLLAHADVRRILLSLRAYNQAGRAFVAYISQQLDTARYASDGKARSRAQSLVDLLTPVLKAFASDKGFEGCVGAQQVYGGHGFIREHGMEQMVRDARIAMLYEGANGVISLDLVARKVVANGGRLVQLFLKDIDNCLVALEETKANPWLTLAGQGLGEARQVLDSTTEWFLQQPFLAFNNEDEIGAASVEYLHLFGHVAYAYMWARMLLASEQNMLEGNPDFALAKRQLARFYFKRLLPCIHTQSEAIRSGAQPLMGMPTELF